MKHRKLVSFVLSLVFVVGCLSLPMTVSAATPSGTGTQTDPYLITNAEDLAWVHSQVMSGNSFSGKYLKLTADIDYEGTAISPIGNQTNAFSGNFDGNGKKVSNFTMETSSRAGLFAYLKGATVTNLQFENAVITASTNSGYGGVLAGFAIGCTVSNIKVASDCSVTGYYVGGIIGRTGKNGSVLNNITYCVNNATVSTDGLLTGEAAGGIVGLALSANISYCQNNGAISAGKATGEQIIGGIAGRFGGELAATLSYCVNTGAISGTNATGGIAGKSMLAGSKYEYCVSTVPLVKGNVDYSGSLVGRYNLAATADNCKVMINDTYGVSGKKEANGTETNIAVFTASSATKELSVFRNYVNALSAAIHSGMIMTFEATEGVRFGGVQMKNADAGKYGIRFVATVDDYEKYDQVGFMVTISNGKQIQKNCTTAYTSVCQSIDNNTVYKEAYEMNGNFLVAYAIHNIPVSEGALTFTVTPYYVIGNQTTTSPAYVVNVDASGAQVGEITSVAD